MWTSNIFLRERGVLQRRHRLLSGYASRGATVISSADETISKPSLQQRCWISSDKNNLSGIRTGSICGKAEWLSNHCKSHTHVQNKLRWVRIIWFGVQVIDCWFSLLMGHLLGNAVRPPLLFLGDLQRKWAFSNNFWRRSRHFFYLLVFIALFLTRHYISWLCSFMLNFVPRDGI